ncbi:GIY-YIG nuclease family protein [Neptuniibacter sp.]|uniref:GIY-YIG nuclease family protein n=1 Tax=Neptuniibacter sp. TaxID=1962643 RepID=UPI002613B914|nr:GIY-YIG nuclease family protein [Neptuniibacter sp.]MCP4596297.1 GIY-YIG nuclease family protein [Neptuniibacter sp.]
MSDWFVYMLRCSDDTLYTGVTTDTQRRLRQHNGELVGGAKYTKLRRPVEMIWTEPHPDRSTASKREYAIKKLPRQKKLELVG